MCCYTYKCFVEFVLVLLSCSNAMRRTALQPDKNRRRGNVRQRTKKHLCVIGCFFRRQAHHDFKTASICVARSHFAAMHLHHPLHDGQP
jgi:hypothetical protein